MIRVHAPAFCIKEIKNSLIMREVCQSSGELMEIYFFTVILRWEVQLWS